MSDGGPGQGASDPRVEVVEVYLAGAPASAVASGDAWLTPAEREVLSRLTVPKRAADWRLGRWVAKDAALRALGAGALGRDTVEILAGPGGAPQVKVLDRGRWPDVAISLSHAAGMGFAAAAAGTLRLGCDVEAVAPRSESFVEDYFTEAEAEWIRAVVNARDERANLLWSAKESALKALGEGLRLDTRSVEVTVIAVVAEEDWVPLRVTLASGDVWPGTGRVHGGFTWTVVSDRAHSLRVPSGAPGG